MVSLQSLGLLLLALSALLVALAAVLATTIPADHMISITITLPLWLTQLHRFATADPLAELSSRLPPVSRTTWNRMRSSHDDVIERPAGGGDSARTTAMWRKISELLDDLATRGFYPFSSDESGSAASPLGSYDMWPNDDDDDDGEDPATDSDACTRLYQDSKQHQVCAISI